MATRHSTRISVRIFRRTGRKNYEAQWTDPLTGRKKTRSTKTSIKRDAQRFATRLEDQIRAGEFTDADKVTWEELCEQYAAAIFPNQRQKTRLKTNSMFNAIDRILRPKWAAAIGNKEINQFTSRLRSEGLSEFTVKGHLAELRKVLRWANRVGLVAKMPHIEMPKKLTGAKGRAITAEEFERYCAKVPDVVGVEAASSWIRLIEGLWWSGLRLAEAMVLRWDDDRDLCVDLSGKRPMLLIRAHAEKGGKDRVLPMAPEFAEFLLKTPVPDRRGYVFNPRGLRAESGRLTVGYISHRLTAIGRAATVKVSDSKCASAHDFRRAFGFRWSQRVLPPVLMELMRHEDIATTMQFYVQRNAAVSAEAIWDAFANTFANKSPARVEMLQQPETEDSPE